MEISESKSVIANAMLVGVGPDAGVIPRGYLVLDGPLISELGRGDPPAVRASWVLDAAGKLVMPGLVNCHNHVAMSLLRGVGSDLNLEQWLKDAIWPAEHKLTREDVFWGSLHSICEMVLGGTTAFADMYFHMDQVARAADAVGIRAILSQGMVGRDNSDWWRTFFATMALWKNWNNLERGKIKVVVGPHAVYTCPPPWLGRAIRLAGRLGTWVQIHLSETADEVRECVSKHGISPIGLYYRNGGRSIKTLAAHCVHLSSEDIQLFRSFKEVYVVHCPWSNLYLGSGIAPVRELLEAGIPVCLGTDGPASSSLDMFETMRLAALLQKGHHQRAAAFSARQAFLMATVTGARALGINAGYLSPGREADLVVLNLDKPSLQPLSDPIASIVYEGGPELVKAVMIAGEWVVQDGRLVQLERRGISQESVGQQVNERHRRLICERTT